MHPALRLYMPAPTVRRSRLLPLPERTPLRDLQIIKAAENFFPRWAAIGRLCVCLLERKTLIAETWLLRLLCLCKPVELLNTPTTYGKRHTRYEGDMLVGVVTPLIPRFYLQQHVSCRAFPPLLRHLFSCTHVGSPQRCLSSPENVVL